MFEINIEEYNTMYLQKKGDADYADLVEEPLN